MLKGVITDKDGPVIGATVYLQNESQRVVVGTITSYQGDYLVVIPATTDKLDVVVSFIGYKTQVVPYTGQTSLDIVIEDDAQAIAGVEIVTEAQKTNIMGISVENIGTATEVIDITQFEDVSATSVEEILQGRLANVDIVATSGDPGAVSQIRIRGDASFNESNEPLIVIDGIPQSVEIDDTFDFGDADVDDFGALLSIAPDDIQSIEVLKDAAATTLWGSDAANGVLMVTTKQGGNYRPRFNVSQKVNTRFEPEVITMLNASEYTTLMQDAMWNWVRDSEYSQSNIDALTTQYDILYDPSYIYYDEFNVDTDWLDLITRNSVNSTTSFSMSGGGDKATYRFSLSYEDQVGTTIGTDYVRITSRLNLNYKFSNKFSVDVGFNYTDSDTNAPLSSPRSIAIARMPNMSPYVIDDETGLATSEYFAQPSDCIQGSDYNPVALSYESKSNTLNRKLGASVNGKYNMARGLVLNVTTSFDMTTTRNSTFLPESATNVLWSADTYNRGVEGLSNTTQMYMRALLNYSRSFEGNHKIVVGLQETIKATDRNSYSITTSGNGDEAVASPSSGGKVTSMSSSNSSYREVGFVGTISYDYDNRFAFTPAARMAGNSNQGAAKNFQIPRPSISGVWKAHNEPFVRRIKAIEELRMRISYGQSERTPSSNYVSGTYTYQTDYMSESAIAPNTMELNNLLPEVVTQLDIGADVSLKPLGISFSVDWYDKTTSDMLQTNSIIQSTTGYETLKYYNSGVMKNQGWEFSIAIPKIITVGKFQFGVSNFNLSRNINTIVEIPYNMEAENFTLANAEYASKIVEGAPFGAIYGFEFLGIYQNYTETYARDANGQLITDINGDYVNTTIGSGSSTWYQRAGDSQYADLNYDGVIDEYDLIYVGNSRPTLIGGLTLSFKYGSWSLRTSFQFRLGQSIINMTRHTTEGMSDGDNQSTAVLNRWRYEGDITEIPRALYSTNYNSLGSDKFVEDGSYLKARDITLNYRVPAAFSRKLGLSNVMVYATASNLFTITNYSGQDPEVSVTSGAYALAIDNSETPPARRLAVGISFGF